MATKANDSAINPPESFRWAEAEPLAAEDPGDDSE